LTYAYESKKIEDLRDSRDLFRQLRNVPLSHADRTKIRDAIGGLATPKSFAGAVARLEASHGFAAIDGRGDWIFFHESHVTEGLLAQLVTGKRVKFFVGLCLRVL
jgi:cold shock CspA family protein